MARTAGPIQKYKFLSSHVLIEIPKLRGTNLGDFYCQRAKTYYATLRSRYWSSLLLEKLLGTGSKERSGIWFSHSDSLIRYRSPANVDLKYFQNEKISGKSAFGKTDSGKWSYTEIAINISLTTESILMTFLELDQCRTTL